MNEFRLSQFVVPAVAMAVVTAGAQMPQALVKDGNIIVRSQDGSERRITTSGRDSDPSVSCDGRHIAFIRKVGQYPGANGVPADKTEIWLADLTGPTPALRVALDRPVELGKYRSYFFTSPELSPGGDAVYFLVPEYAAVSSGLFRLDLESGQVRFLAKALDFWVICCGPYKRNLVAHQNPMLVVGGRYDVYNMIDSSGTVIGVAGFNEENIRTLLFCEEGE